MDFGKVACSLHLRIQLSDLPSYGTALAILRSSQAHLLFHNRITQPKASEAFYTLTYFQSVNK